VDKPSSSPGRAEVMPLKRYATAEVATASHEPNAWATAAWNASRVTPGTVALSAM